MINIRIHGIADGEHKIETEAPVTEAGEIFPEFFGNISISGTLRKYGKRFAFTGTAVCMAKLICDLSLEEYEEQITSELEISFMADTRLYMMKGDSEDAEAEERIVHEDDEFFDIGEVVREQLALKLPMKRIAPQYREKDIKELFPGIIVGEESEEIEPEKLDERWSALKNLKLN